MQAASPNPGNPLVPSEFQFLNAIADKANAKNGKVETKDLAQLFKEKAPHSSKTTVSNFLNSSVNKLKEQVYLSKSTVELKKELQGSIIGLKILHGSLSKSDQTENLSKIRELEKLSNASPGEILLQKAAKRDPSILEMMKKDPRIIQDFNNIVEIYGPKRRISSESVALICKLRETDPEVFTDSLSKIKVARDQNLELLKNNKLMLPQNHPANREASRAYLDLMGMIFNLTEDSSSPVALDLKLYLSEIATKSYPTNSQLHQETIIHAIRPDFANRTMNSIREANNQWQKELKSLENIEPFNEKHSKEINKTKDYFQGLKDYFPREQTNMYEKATWEKVEGTPYAWKRTIGIRAHDGIEPYKKEDELVVELNLSEFTDVDELRLFDFIRHADSNEHWTEEFARDGLNILRRPDEFIEMSDEDKIKTLSADAIVALDKLNLSNERKVKLLTTVAKFTQEINVGYPKRQFLLGS